MVMFHSLQGLLGFSLRMKNVSLFGEYGSHPHPTALPVSDT